MVDDMTNKEIANSLGITEATVKCHVSTILMRLSVSDRTQAVVTALQRGLVHFTTVRLKIEENQLINVFGEFSVYIGSLKSA